MEYYTLSPPTGMYLEIILTLYVIQYRTNRESLDPAARLHKIWDYIQRWRQMATCMIRSQFEYMKATERELYKDNSFFEQHKYDTATSGTDSVGVLGVESHERSPSVLSDDTEVHDDESDFNMEEGSDSSSETSSTDDSSDVDMEGKGEGREASLEDSIK